MTRTRNLTYSLLLIYTYQQGSSRYYKTRGFNTYPTVSLILPDTVASEYADRGRKIGIRLIGRSSGI